MKRVRRANQITLTLVVVLVMRNSELAACLIINFIEVHHHPTSSSFNPIKASPRANDGNLFCCLKLDTHLFYYHTTIHRLNKKMALRLTGRRFSRVKLASHQKVLPLSSFAKIPQGPPDPIFGLTDAFNKASDRPVVIGVHVLIYSTHTCKEGASSLIHGI